MTANELDEDPFPSALFSSEWPTATHLIELAMRDLSYAIRSKSSWWTKYKDEAIRAKWMEEAKAQPIRGFMLSTEHVQYVLDELTAYDKARDENGLQPGLQKGFWESDNLVKPALKDVLEKELSKLRDVPEDEKDWHPGSDKQVLDLVHPSMYCMRYGKTHLKDGTLAQAPAMREHESFVRLEGVSESYSDATPAQKSGYSNAISWLPTDIEIAPDAESIAVKDYFNNVHPANQQGLHEALTGLLQKFIPMFENLLGDLRNYSVETVLGDVQSELDETNRPINPETNQPVDYWEDDDSMRAWEEFLATGPYIDPKPGKYEPEVRTFGTGYSLNGKTIQIIAKIAEIDPAFVANYTRHLTPERPHYAGGGWHIEGMLNESIVATGIHYLASENITTSKLSFRMGLDPSKSQEIDYEQEDPSEILLRSYGLKRDSPLNQYLGAFEARAGRSIVFPNLYQHKVEPFSLLCPLKPGRRTIIAFFLCDPTYRVLSTSDVAPQQADWLRSELHSNCATSRLHNLAPELKDQIVGHLVEDEVVLERSQAEEVRELLMQERSRFQVSQNEEVFEAEFSLCEH